MSIIKEQIINNMSNPETLDGEGFYDRLTEKKEIDLLLNECWGKKEQKIGTKKDL